MMNDCVLIKTIKQRDRYCSQCQKKYNAHKKYWDSQTLLHVGFTVSMVSVEMPSLRLLCEVLNFLENVC